MNQRKVGRTILQKTRSNVVNRINEDERSQNDVTASVSADHDYNGQNSGTNGNVLKCIFLLSFKLITIFKLKMICVYNVFEY